ncbi:unnamed protein product [Linum trigynum]|uniref:Uncharacterized protein n=1 Tax=Linum trigynum TaxID=586398 RepID=A0AAV2E450_9ROSI
MTMAKFPPPSVQLPYVSLQLTTLSVKFLGRPPEGESRNEIRLRVGTCSIRALLLKSSVIGEPIWLQQLQDDDQ